MGQRLIRFDDYDNREDDTVAKREFSVGRTCWEIDLSDENHAALLAALEPWIAKAKKVRGMGIKASAAPRQQPAPILTSATGDPDDDPGTAAPPALRFTDVNEPQRLAAWATDNKVLLARPGRPPRAVLLAFRADDVEQVPDRYRLVNATA